MYYSELHNWEFEAELHSEYCSDYKGRIVLRIQSRIILLEIKSRIILLGIKAELYYSEYKAKILQLITYIHMYNQI